MFCPFQSIRSHHAGTRHFSLEQREKNQHFQAWLRCSNNVGQSTAHPEIGVSCYGLELIVYQMVFLTVSWHIYKKSECLHKVSPAHALLPTSSKVQDTINTQSNTQVFLTMRVMKNGSTFKVFIYCFHWQLHRFNFCTCSWSSWLAKSGWAALCIQHYKKDDSHRLLKNSTADSTSTMAGLTWAGTGEISKNEILKI